MRNLTATICLILAVLLGTPAQAETYSCEVKRFKSDAESLKIIPYSKIGVSLIIDRQASTVSFSYAEHGRRWKNIFKISDEDENAILGIENFEVDKVRIIFFEKLKKTVHFVFVGDTGNTMNFGKCYD
jgi:hypothetical protein